MSKIKIVDHSADTQASKKRYGGKALQLLLALLIPVALFYLTDSLKYNPFEALNKSAHPYNILIYELIFLFLFFLTGRVRIALPIQILLFFVSGLANYYVMEFRTNPIVPWDIFSIKTAASVAENYSYALPGETILHLSGYLVLLLISLLIPLKFPKKTFWIRLLPAAAVAVIFAGFYHLLGDAGFRARHGIYDKQFTPVSMYKKEGLALNFLMNLHFVFVDVPEGYEKEEMEELLAKAAGAFAPADPAEPTGQNYPNIVVIMDEAFSDLTVLGDMPTNTDPIPFVHSMREGAEDTVSGTLNVSVVGGNTANTEFEFLTGNTMAFLPTGSIPYQQYINGEISALPRYLESLGYDTVAMHPYYPTGWERNEVYPHMGFSRMLFKDDFTDTRILRKYVDDASDFENVIRQFENKGADPLFVFNVTMQNHSSYS
ncbi:MAG: LTA synthase family protein, partial [Lachnospiraceae bacterium]|nr:LTA synthase family protein [Lachnospiraceae bacterium]